MDEHCIIYSDVKFKYISCSYLSLHKITQNHLRKKFKYISCSYLSANSSSPIYPSCIQIHLMFLFINSQSPAGKRVGLIQIHLMFLFIMFSYSLHNSDTYYSNTSHVLIYRLAPNQYKIWHNRFKYISCSYLSGTLCTL